jgi:hypothetical protein
MIARLASLLRDRRGNATIELAFMTPILLVMGLASIDATLGFVHRMNVQEQAQIGADYVYSKMEDIPLAAQIKLEINAATGVPVSDITIDEWVECDGVVVHTPMCVQPGATETKFMTINVDGTYTPILDIPYFADFIQSYTHTGSVTIQVE